MYIGLAGFIENIIFVYFWLMKRPTNLMNDSLLTYIPFFMLLILHTIQNISEITITKYLYIYCSLRSFYATLLAFHSFLCLHSLF